MKFQKMAFSVFESSVPELRSQLINSYQQGWQQSIKLNLQLNKENRVKSYRSVGK